MAQERDPQDPFRPTRGEERYSEAPILDNELQPDPELSEGPASPTRVALYAVVAAVILGAVFYGLNTGEPTGTTSTTPTAQTTPAPTSTPKSDRGAVNPNLADQTRPPVAPGVRDVTPAPNSQPGVTTGAAPAQPPSPSAPPPATDSGKAQ